MSVPIWADTTPHECWQRQGAPKYRHWLHQHCGEDNKSKSGTDPAGDRRRLVCFSLHYLPLKRGFNFNSNPDIKALTPVCLYWKVEISHSDYMASIVMEPTRHTACSDQIPHTSYSDQHAINMFWADPHKTCSDQHDIKDVLTSFLHMQHVFDQLDIQHVVTSICYNMFLSASNTTCCNHYVIQHVLSSLLYNMTSFSCSLL